MKLIFSAKFPIRPQAKQSANFFNDKHTGKLRSRTQPKKAEYIKELSRLIKMNFIGRQSKKPLFLSVVFNFFHKTERGVKPTRPDIDNLLKPLKDAMDGLVYKDDKQIVSVSATKNYSSENSIIVEVFEVSDREALSA